MEKKKQIIQLLKQANIFSNLKDDELEIISNYSDIYYFKKDDNIYKDLIEDQNKLFIINKGNVIISRDLDNNKKLILAHYIDNESFGELDLFTNSKRNFSAIAETDSEILIFPKIGIKFQNLLSEHPSIFAQILHKFMVMIATRIRNTNKIISEKSPWVESLKNQLYKDKLTGLYNNTYFDEEFPRIINELEKPISFMYIKPDNFKDINDNFGHEAGDNALKYLAEQIKLYLNKYIVVRYRGNESCAILSGITKNELYKMADDLRKKISSMNIKKITNNNDFFIKVSIGIASYPDDANNTSDLLKNAYDAMMISRNSGGDKVILYEKK